MMMKVQRGEARLVFPAEAAAPAVVALSSSDLAVPSVHVEVLYAFHGPASPSSMDLQQGLRHALCFFPEWAGCIAADRDQGGHGHRPSILLLSGGGGGVPFVDASADFPLLHLSPFNPSPFLLHLIPLHAPSSPHLLLVQVTRFSCGGWTLGIARNHQVADGEAASQFMDTWARAVKGLPAPQVVPLHDRTAMMPRDPPHPIFDHPEYAPRSPPPAGASAGELSVNKFHFCLEALKRIKEAAAEGGGGARYSTFVSLVAHLWRCITKARGLDGDEESSTTTRALVAVNVRKRMEPELPEGFFGNAMCSACAETTIRNLTEGPVSYAAGLIDAAVRRVSEAEYIRSALDFVEVRRRQMRSAAGGGGGGAAAAAAPGMGRNKATVMSPDLSVTSWVRLPLYDVDFGYGSPIFAGNPYIPFEGLLILLPSPDKDGSIDVVLALFAPAMQKFEALCYSAF